MATATPERHRRLRRAQQRACRVRRWRRAMRANTSERKCAPLQVRWQAQPSAVASTCRRWWRRARRGVRAECAQRRRVRSTLPSATDSIRVDLSRSRSRHSLRTAMRQSVRVPSHSLRTAPSIPPLTRDSRSRHRPLTAPPLAPRRRCAPPPKVHHHRSSRVVWGAQTRKQK
jgi:hypothetical protein